MTSDLGQQQFNLSNLSARAGICRDSSGIFVSSCFRCVEYDRRVINARFVTSHVRVELFKKQLSLLKTIRDRLSFPAIIFAERCFVLPLEECDSRDIYSEYFSSGNRANGSPPFIKFLRSLNAILTMD